MSTHPQFIDRNRELEALELRYRSKRSEFVVITGRRRVGKTALLTAFAQGKRALRFTAYLDSEESQLRRLSAYLYQIEHPGLQPALDFTYGSWEMLFRTMGSLATAERLLVILDEWPYIAGSSSRLASVLQHSWDEVLQHTQLMLILNGSYFSVMERDILDRKAPLYGRRTSHLFLKPLAIQDAALFLPDLAAEEFVDFYATVGGMPGYLQLMTEQQTIWAALRRVVFNRDSFLYQEPDLLLREELREPRLYAALLRAIAQGHHTVSAISKAAGFSDRATATRYLDTLRGLGLVENRRPVGPITNQRAWGAWYLVDPYLRFWGHWILPYTTQIEFDEAEWLIQEIVRPGWDTFVAFAWEEIARQHVYHLSAQRVIPFWAEEVGSWWSKQAQIDLVAVHRERRSVLLGESRWRRQLMNVADLVALQAKSKQWLGDERGWDFWYALYSRSGFTAELRELAARDSHIILQMPENVVDRG
ncbi:MAG: ATP-binding protein [Caldilineaceae bacterium]